MLVGAGIAYIYMQRISRRSPLEPKMRESHIYMQRISRRTPPKKAAKSHIYMQRISRRSPPEVAKLRFWTWKSVPPRGL